MMRPILELYADRTPGSLVEEKDFSLVWHYRQADPSLASVRMQELRGALASLTENMDVGVFEGSKILEIRRYGISKGHAVDYVTAGKKWDFLLAGDDYTDEEMFAALPENAYSSRWPGFSKPASGGYGADIPNCSGDWSEYQMLRLDNFRHIVPDGHPCGDL